MKSKVESEIEKAIHSLFLKVEAIKEVIKSHPGTSNLRNMIEIPKGLWSNILLLNDDVLKDLQNVQKTWLEEIRK